MNRRALSYILILFGMFIGAALAYHYAASPAEPYLVPGEQWLGEPAHNLPPATIDPTPMDVRVGCFWGQPGSNPFTGNHYSAMRAMGATPDEAIEIDGQRKHPQHFARRIYRSNAGMWTSDNKTVFMPVSVQSFGKNIVCLGTTANFRSDDAVEVGDLYHFGDMWYAIWHACNNGDRVFPIPDAAITAAPLYGVPEFGPVYPGPEGLPGAGRAHDRAVALLYPLVLARPPLRGRPLPHRPTPDVSAPGTTPRHTVPEPSVFVMLAWGVVLLVWLRRR